MLQRVTSSKPYRRTTSAMRVLALAALSAAVHSSLRAQDTRTVTEPAFPATCQTLAAQQPIVNGEPTSETLFDTSRLQSALNACKGTGEAVELTASGANNAFLIQPISIPTGVVLLVDGGVTVFASRNPADYQAGTPSATRSTCGTVDTIGNGCTNLISNNGNSPSTGQGIMGYGIIDGRGGDDLIVNGVVQSYSWWDLSIQAVHPTTLQSNPEMINITAASDFTLYKITLRNSPLFHFKEFGGATLTSGLTAWGVKILAPYISRNTDGIDVADNFENVTIKDTYISNGDDMVNLQAGTAAGSSVSHVSITNMHTYSGMGVSINGLTTGGVSDVLVDTLNQQGNALYSSAAGIRIRTDPSEGGLVNNITYQNVCTENQVDYVQMDANITSTTVTTHPPTLQNITLRNVSIIAGSRTGAIDWRGYSASMPLSLTLDNFQSTVTPKITPAAQYTNITLAGGPVVPTSLQSLTGTGVTYTGQVTNPTEAAFPCSSANFPLLAGELYGSTSSSTNQQALSLTYPASFTLNAVAVPTSLDPGLPTLTSAITFYDGKTSVGTASLSGNGSIASLALSGAAVGTHTYSAVYPVDATHPTATSFGSVALTVAAAPTTTSLALSATQVAAFTPVTLTATVASSYATPTGTVTFFNGSSTLGTGVLNSSGVATLTVSNLPVGVYSITASSPAGNFVTSVSTAQTLTVIAPVTVTAAPATLTLQPGKAGNVDLSIAPNPGFTGTVTVTCSSPVTNVICTVIPATVSISATATQPAVTTVTILVLFNYASLQHMPGLGQSPVIAFAMLLPASLLLLGRYRKQRLAFLNIFFVMAAGCAILSLSACSKASNPTPTALGSQTITVTATANNVPVTTTISVTITK